MTDLLMAKQILNTDLELDSSQDEIPFIELKRQYSQFKYDIRTAINRVLASGYYTSGPEVEAFEGEFAAYCGVPYCVGVSSGTEAIEMGLKALGIQRGDEVVTVANAGLHSTLAILEIGAQPLFAEIDPITMTMSPEGLISAITPRTRAVIITHLYGRVANLRALCTIADQFDLAVVEDCFQAHGASLNGKPVGSWGDMGCFCFSPVKNLGALGEAGAIITRDLNLIKNLRIFRQYDCSENNNSHYSGEKPRSMDEIQAAVLRAKLPMLEEMNLKRRMIAQTYNINLDTSNSKLHCDYHPEQSVFQLFVVRTDHRDPLRDSLERQGIGCGVHYAMPDHLHDSCQNLGYLAGMLPETERASREVLSLPCYPELTSWEIEQVCAAVNECLAEE